MPISQCSATSMTGSGRSSLPSRQPGSLRTPSLQLPPITGTCWANADSGACAPSSSGAERVPLVFHCPARICGPAGEYPGLARRPAADAREPRGRRRGGQPPESCRWQEPSRDTCVGAEIPGNATCWPSTAARGGAGPVADDKTRSLQARPLRAVGTPALRSPRGSRRARRLSRRTLPTPQPGDELQHEILEQWDAANLPALIAASVQRRTTIFEANNRGRPPVWDHAVDNDPYRSWQRSYREAWQKTEERALLR